MADMGLAGMGGAAGAGDALQTMFEQRMQAAANQRADQQQQQQQQEFQQNQARLEASMRIGAWEKAAAAREAIKKEADQTAQRQAARDTATFTNTPVGGEIQPVPAQRMQDLGLPMTKIAGPQVRQTSGFMPLPSAPSQGPGMQATGGELTPVHGGPPSPSPSGPQIAPGAATTTPDPTSPLNAPSTFKRGATQADLVKAQGDKQKADTSEWQNSIRQELATLKEGAGPKVPTPHYSEPKDVFNPETGRFELATTTFNTATGTYEPVRGATPTAPHKASPGDQQTATWNAKRVDAIGKIHQVDTAIDEAKDLIGPGAGRISSLEQMIGNPDPKISALKTKLLTIKDQVAGALTMSNRQPSPTMLKRFDELLGAQLTPESLHAATKALAEMLAPEGKTTAGKTFHLVGDKWVEQ